ncbi:MAG: hypothetical protein J6P73_06270 [Bacteroidales bacterium]|nr:hypothetical protein [Bacteroidales bacterium]
MEQQLVVVRIDEAKDDERIARNRERLVIPLSQLKPGTEIEISERRKLKVVKLNSEELVFMVDARTYVLNRYWQVLGTVKMDVPCDWHDETERFTFHFETPVEKAEKGVYEHMVELMDAMNKNSDKGKLWKNIPLAREMMHLFKDWTPLRDEEISPVVRMQGVNAIAHDRMLPVNDTPRLFLSFLEYWEICNDLVEGEDGQVNDAESFAKSLDDQLFKYTWIVDPSMTSDLYDKMFGKDNMLRIDFVQFTPAWEKAVYDIELETEQEVGEEYQGMGFCFEIWSAKTAKAAKHGIRWRDPHIMNPRVMFD